MAPSNTTCFVWLSLIFAQTPRVGCEEKLLSRPLSICATDVTRILLWLAPVSTERRKKAGKIIELALIYLAKGGEIEVNPLSQGMTRPDVKSPGAKGERMGGIKKETKPPKPVDDKPKKLPPARVEDDEPEDGDIATPKRDRHGNDDEPL